MKIGYLFLIVCISLFACKKDKTSPANCDLLIERSNEFGTSQYEYDAQGRILKETISDGRVRTYEYPDDRTVKTKVSNEIEDIALNDKNEVIRLETHYNNGQKMILSYEFGTDGLPVSFKAEEFGVGENQPYRTTVNEMKYKITDGNPYYISFKDQQTGQKIEFEYTYDLSRLNNLPKGKSYFIYNPIYEMPKSKNLPISLRVSGLININSNISYEFDTKGRITKLTSKPTNQSSPSVEEYRYKCN